MAMYEKLFPIKVPTGWATIHHAFGDVDPVVQDGVIINDEFYNEDLLSIESLCFKDGVWAIDSEGYVLDLGWYPESTPEGCYRLTVLKGGWDNVVAQVESKDRSEIHLMIERCFSLLLQGIEDAALHKQLVPVPFSAA